MERSSRWFWIATLTLSSGMVWSLNMTSDDLVERSVEHLPDVLSQAVSVLSGRARVENDFVTGQGTGQANTLAARLLYTTPSYKNTAALIEFNHVVAYANSKFNEGQGLTPSRANKPIIRDPNGTALTRAYLQYNKFSDYTFRLGRQFIDLDDERFIGSDQFRQTPQNYDAFTMTSTVFYQMELYYAYIFQVNTVYSGSGAPTSTNNHQTHAVNISWNGLPYGTLTGYAYLVNDRATITNSTNTLGVRLEGDWLLGSLDTGYVLEYAHQRDAHDNPTHFSADYTAAKVYTGFAPLQLYAAYQVFDGNVVSGRGFRTPLASFSRLNGWAEQFNPLPDAGLIDINGGILGRVSNIALELHYHLFKSETPQRKIAQEYDVSISKHLFSHYQMGIDYARFIAQPGSGYSDAHKIWLTLEANY